MGSRTTRRAGAPAGGGGGTTVPAGGGPPRGGGGAGAERPVRAGGAHSWSAVGGGARARVELRGRAPAGGLRLVPGAAGGATRPAGRHPRAARAGLAAAGAAHRTTPLATR